jgi:aryl-alcohol dehydrogenase-like predicted oxidoreductase
MIKAGHIRYIGLSEVGPETIRRAHAVHPVSDLQIEYSIVSRDPEAQIFPVLRELGIGVTAYGVLSRGLLSGSKPSGEGDLRGHLPRFAGENMARNQKLVRALDTIAREKGATTAQLSIAWVLAKSETIVPLIGARTRNQLDESLGAIAIRLSASDVAQIEKVIPRDAAAGSRYGTEQMRMLDSEHARG